MTELPLPECQLGYTKKQISEIFTFDESLFRRWMRGQTVSVCEGRSYNHDTQEYEESCGGVAHGIVYYPWDVQRFIDGLPVVD
jgi:hypothetical protein